MLNLPREGEPDDEIGKLYFYAPLADALNIQCAVFELQHNARILCPFNSLNHSFDKQHSESARLHVKANSPDDY